LFFFSFFLLLVFFFISKLLIIRKHESIEKTIYLFFYTYITVQTIKVYFIISNYTTLPILIRSLTNLSLNGDYQLINRIILFFLPYVLVLFIIFFISRYRLKKFSRFFLISGYIFLITSVYDISSKLKTSEIKNYINQKINYTKKEQNNNNRVIWIVFDAFDPQIAFKKKDSENFLPNFNKLMKGSFFANNMYPPATQTIESMPSQLMGKPIVDFNFNNNSIEIKSNNNKWTKFIYKNTIFKKLNDKKFNTNILSATLPYCSLLKIYNNCEEPNNNLFKGINYSFPFFSKIKLLIKLYPNKKKKDQNLSRTEIINIDPSKFVNKIKDTDGNNNITIDKIKVAINKTEDNLTFIHLLPPHLPIRGGYTFNRYHSEKVFNVDVEYGSDLYYLNLKLTDLILGIVMKELNKLNNNNLMLLLTSDHWFRPKDKKSKKTYPVLFLAKIFNDNDKIFNEKKLSSSSTIKFIEKYLDKEIKNHNNINNFFKKEIFYETFISRTFNL